MLNTMPVDNTTFPRPQVKELFKIPKMPLQVFPKFETTLKPKKQILKRRINPQNLV